MLIELKSATPVSLCDLMNKYFGTSFMYIIMGIKGNKFREEGGQHIFV